MEKWNGLELNEPTGIRVQLHENADDKTGSTGHDDFQFDRQHVISMQQRRDKKKLAKYPYQNEEI